MPRAKIIYGQREETIGPLEMDRIYQTLADRVLDLLSQSKKPRIIVAVAGVPGSGKTTLSNNVAQIINDRATAATAKFVSQQQTSTQPSLHSIPVPEQPTNNSAAIVVGMDGFHLTRAQLDAMDDPEEAHRRRGAPFTFDADGVVSLVKKLHQSTLEPVCEATTTADKSTNNARVITAPSFDHKVKDPVPDNIVIPAETRIVFLEGLYLLLEDEPWAQIAPLVDDKWYINVDASIARRRVAYRHVDSGITPNLELAYARADGNDATNGIYISTHSSPPDITIQSIDEPSGPETTSTRTCLNCRHVHAVGLQANP
ncbi:Yfh7p [Sugiyamaella lignohabitans]|uniref:Yfh7p n=1 Tax=Sugiyamaella lignohabitans TaxID=796027 RepID=A0A167FC14_9ASCO|nr:Yfh7p [Sugiyamaella lignohabitans]ANB15095.1 Yfh7p [Sugiyamaella lignohabitans]